MDILQQLKDRVEQVEVVNIQRESTSVSFESNRLKSSQVEETSGIAVRVVQDGQLGFAATSDSGALARVVENVLQSAAYGDKIPLIFPVPQPGPEVITYDPAIVNLPISRLVEIGQELVDLFLEIEPEAQIFVDLARGVETLQLRNHTGVNIAFKRSPLSISLRVDRVKEDDVLMLFDVSGTTVWEEDYMVFARQLSEKVHLAKQSASVQSGQMPVLFSPTGALVLGLPLMIGLNGKNVYKGISPMRDKLGEKLFDEKLTVIDDPTIDGRFGSAVYDDEGVPHRRNRLIENGVVSGFLYDLKTAALAGAESTGNGSRGLFNQPGPSPTNLCFQPGCTPLADMLAGIDEGLLVESPLGLGQGNIISGAFSNSWSLAFKIEKGKIVGRVKDISIAGNVYNILQNVAAVSRETEWVYNNFNLPYILLEDVNVVAKA
ncbi:MAG: TldD/PmbA family protein [Anaerolineae bacterium]|nr:TldD/PmbA family protein [Anaerolineae bacterium]